MVNTNGARAARNIQTGAIALTAIRLGVLLVSSWSLPVYAETSERAAMIEQVAHACPEHWTELQSPFLGGEVTVGDLWPGPVDDRDDFVAYLASEMAEDDLTADEISRLADDPMVVIAECSHMKLRLTRYLAAIDAEVAILSVDPAEGDGEGTGFPDGLSQENAATSCGAILVAWPDSPNGDYWIDLDGGDTSNAEQTFCLMAPYPDGSTSEFAALSCNDIKNNYPNSDSGVYWLDADGGDTANAITAYCDMTSAGGGWTLVAAQFEEDQLVDWNEGTQSDYDPSLETGRSFTLSSAQIPAHTETAFGKSLDPVFVDYVDFVYTPFSIQKTLVVGKKTGKGYHVHRNLDSHGYAFGDPEGSLFESASMIGRFTFDETGGQMRTWCYSPSYYAQARGYSMLGDVSGTTQSYAWTVWVR
jgi:hypothetical protein